MQFGAGAVNSLPLAEPGAMREYARGAEALGYDFLTLIDHVVMAHPEPNGTPRSVYPPDTPYHDILVALGYLAGVTERIRLRTAVVILPQRGPAVVAKQAAAADSLSGGRVDLGLGIGWQEPEYEALGVPFGERGTRMDEGISVMKALWDQERVDHSGHHYTLDGIAMEPKPAQRPHPALWFGGTTAPAYRRVVEHGVGWLARPVQPVDEIAQAWGRIRTAAAAADRDPDALRLQVSIGLGPDDATGDVIAECRAHTDAGATDISFFTSYSPGLTTPADHVAQLSRAMDEIIPELR